MRRQLAALKSLRRCHSDLHFVQGTHQSYVQQAVVFVAFEEKYLCSSFIVDVFLFSRLIGYQRVV